MITLIRIAARFIKTWFLPFPAHDDFVQARRDSVVDAEEAESDQAEPSEFEAQEDEVPDTSDEEMIAPEAPPRRKKRRRRKSTAVDSSRFEHLVREPEGSEQRLSRGSAPPEDDFEEDDSDEDDSIEYSDDPSISDNR